MHRMLGVSSEELHFLRALHDGGVAERAALSAAMDTFNQSDGHPKDASGPVDIPPLRLLLAMLPLPIIALLSLHLRLGLHNKLAIAAARCAAQLSVLGFVLVPIFVTNNWWLTALYTLFMLLVAAAEAVSRPSQTYDGMLFEVLVAMGVACAGSISFGLAAVVNVRPWYDAQYLIPMLGMLMGNSCSSVAVGLSAVLEDLSAGREKVESLLALGASRIEATREVVQRAARLALTPLLNSMNVVGIVAIPGMMTGQILGGSDPAVAARYQIVIYYLVAISSSLSAIATIYAAVMTVCDAKHRLRAEKLKIRTSRGTGAVLWFGDQLKAAWVGLKARGGRVHDRVQRAFASQAGPRGRHRISQYLSVGQEEERSRAGLEPLLGARKNQRFDGTT